jgi:O-antigen ligase
VLAVSAPLAVFIGVVWSDLPVGVMAGCLIAATTVLLVRADAVFLSTWGVPTPSVLFEAKYTQTPYDFHYYTLGNPNHTAGWLLIAVTLSGLWVADRSLGTAHRAALGVALGVTALTLVLTYSRLAIATAIAIGVIALVRLTPRTRVRWATLAATALVVLIGMAANRTYLRSLFGTSSDATIPERLGSLGDGLIALAGDPFTGVGLGRFGPESGFVPAHSSIIQAAAEMGVLGLCALLLLSYGIVAHGIRVVRASGWAGLGPAAAVAVATYAIYAAFAASANEGLYSGYNAVWGLTAACVLGVSLRIEAEREPAPGRAARVPRS